MKKKSKLIALLLIVSLIIPGYTVSAYSPHFEYEAQMLYDLELFKGTGNGFELNDVCDRLQGATMFVRLLGEENKAINNPKSHPFIDVQNSWASPYVGQMYAQGYTKGSSATEYGAGTMTANQFATFCLRALDYQDGVDFTVDIALSKMLELHIIREDTFNLIANDSVFYRDYAVKLAYNTLAAEYKTRRTLPFIEQTIKDFCAGTITEEEILTIWDSMELKDIWEIYIENGYNFNNASTVKKFLDIANEHKEILLMQLYRNGAVSKENLLKNILWIEDDMYLYTLPEFFDKYLESTICDYKAYVIEKCEIGLGDIIVGRKSAHPYKGWEAYDDSAYTITTNPFDLSTPSFSPSPYAVTKIDYGPVRRCEYYLKGTHHIDLTEREKKVCDFVQKEFLDKITDDMDAYDKVMAANKFLVDNVVYDRTAYPYSNESFFPLFEEGRASCCGFSQVFQFLMKLVDVECYIVDLDMENNPQIRSNHAWNIVRLDSGILYHVDTSVVRDNPFPRLSASTVEHADYEPIYVIEPIFGDPKDIKR